MRTYILFTFAIYGIGGTQIYARNKILFMLNKGWKTCLVTTEPGEEIMVKEMRPYVDGVFPELMRNPYLYPFWKRNKIIKRVISYIRKFAPIGTEIVIESNFMAITPWAELIAQKLKAKNFIFLIQEDYRIKSKQYLDFFAYKLKKGEMAANTSGAFTTMFEGKFTERPEHLLSATCSNVIEDCESVISDKLPVSDFNIGSIGRINKPFVLPMVNQVVEYVKSNPNLKFNLVLFGGSPEEKDISSIMSATSGISNLNVLVTGALFPIPLCDVKAMDVCISAAGAARTSSHAGILTISMDAIDYEPIGIVDVTTNQTILRGDSEKISLSRFLDEILIEKKYNGILKEHVVDYSRNFERDMGIVLKQSSVHDYYPVHKLAPGYIVSGLNFLLGDKYSLFAKIIKHLTKKPQKS